MATEAAGAREGSAVGGAGLPKPGKRADLWGEVSASRDNAAEHARYREQVEKDVPGAVDTGKKIGDAQKAVADATGTVKAKTAALKDALEADTRARAAVDRGEEGAGAAVKQAGEAV
ncbi:hypothetical protein, partial [Streptomyces tsukubensis]|uniref:hypothetical protein n=1 Tax=Streptomyces tsukubensis TaxID=83656 RepID=UPI00117C3D02